MKAAVVVAVAAMVVELELGFFKSELSEENGGGLIWWSDSGAAIASVWVRCSLFLFGNPLPTIFDLQRTGLSGL